MTDEACFDWTLLTNRRLEGLGAEALGVKGLRLGKPEDIVPVLKQAFDTAGPVLIGLHVGCRDNLKLFEMVHEDSFHISLENVGRPRNS